MQDTENRATVTDKSNSHTSNSLALTSEAETLLGQAVPAFSALATDNFEIVFENLKGYQTLLVFYPQNGLPGVTQLVKDLKSQYQAFKKIETCIFGVSIETIEANQKFKDAQKLPFQLIADTEFELSNWFAALTERTLFGDPIKTLEQSTFLIDKDGKIAKAWRNPDIRGHVKTILETAHKVSEGLDDRIEDESRPLLGEGKDQAALAADLAELFES